MVSFYWYDPINNKKCIYNSAHLKFTFKHNQHDEEDEIENCIVFTKYDNVLHSVYYDIFFKN